MTRIEATLRLEEAILAPGVQGHLEQLRHQAPLRLPELMPAQARGFRRDEAALLVLAPASAGARVVAADRCAHRLNLSATRRPGSVALHQSRENILGNASAKRGLGFDQPRDIGEILLSLACAPLWILRRPDLALQHILHARHGQALTEDVSHARMFHERRVARIELNLHSEIASLGRHVHAVFESFHAKMRRQDVGQAAQILHGDDDVEVEADNRLDVRIHGLSANDAEANPTVAQERDEPVEEIGSIHGDGFPEGAAVHAGGWFAFYLWFVGLDGRSWRRRTPGGSRLHGGWIGYVYTRPEDALLEDGRSRVALWDQVERSAGIA